MALKENEACSSQRVVGRPSPEFYHLEASSSACSNIPAEIKHVCVILFANAPSIPDSHARFCAMQELQVD